jgi:arylsulfatase A-like enzyme
MSLRSWLFLAALVLVVVPPASAEAAETSRPNVLFIAIDDLNDWTGCLGGHPDVKTPHIDRLAKRGTLFTRAYCTAPACNPSRASLMTGVRPSTSGVYHNSQDWRPPLQDAITLSSQFMAHGYDAVGAGKIFHGSFPDPRSWRDYHKEVGSPKVSAAVANDPHSKAGGIVWGVLENATDEQMTDYDTVSFAIDYLKQKHEKPFFLAPGLHKPHMPWQVPKKYYDMYPVDKIALPKVPDNDLDDVPLAGRKIAKPEGDHHNVTSTGNWKYAVQGYLATITFADAQIGRLIDALDASPYKDNTIVILWGDHGWHLGEKMHWRKFALWEEATKAPLIYVAPGVTKAGTVCERTVDFSSIYPTLCELCGVPVPKTAEGRSIVSLLKNPAAPWDMPAITTHGRNNHGIRSEQFRYIRYADGSEELYDEVADPNEWTNVAGKPEYARAKAQLAAFLPQTNAEDAEATRGGEKQKQQNKKKKAK